MYRWRDDIDCATRACRQWQTGVGDHGLVHDRAGRARRLQRRHAGAGVRRVDASHRATAHAAEFWRDIDEHWSSGKQLLRELDRQIVTVQFDKRAWHSAVAAGGPQHLWRRQAARLRAKAPSIRRNHRVENVRLIVDDNLMISENREQLLGRESGVDCFVRGAGTTTDIRDAQLRLTMDRPEVTGEDDWRSDHRYEEGAQIRTHGE